MSASSQVPRGLGTWSCQTLLFTNAMKVQFPRSRWPPPALKTGSDAGVLYLRAILQPFHIFERRPLPCYITLHEHFFFPNEVVYVASDNFGLVSSVGKSQLLLKLTSGFLDFTGNFCHGGRSGNSRNCRAALGSMWHMSAKTYHFISLPRSSTSRDWARLTESESIAPFWHGKQTHLLCDS